MVSVEVPELQRHQIGFEAISYGIGHTENTSVLFFVLTPEDWNNEHEGFIGFQVFEDELEVTLGKQPVKTIWDGALYVRRATEEEAVKAIGKKVYDLKLGRAKAVVALMNSSPEILARRKAWEEAERLSTCYYCGDHAVSICPKCNQPVCEECAELPCENDHKEPEPENWDYLRASPEEQVAELQRAEQEDRHRSGF